MFLKSIMRNRILLLFMSLKMWKTKLWSSCTNISWEIDHKILMLESMSPFPLLRSANNDENQARQDLYFSLPSSFTKLHPNFSHSHPLTLQHLFQKIFFFLYLKTWQKLQFCLFWNYFFHLGSLISSNIIMKKRLLFWFTTVNKQRKTRC